MCFLTDGKVEIDNNAAERAMRAIALGRKIGCLQGQTRQESTPLLLSR
ncbi:MAG: transposase [Alphaproteobacteria bacterium]|nr:transposase [Alphaproteobacteria bacterium]